MNATIQWYVVTYPDYSQQYAIVQEGHVIVQFRYKSEDRDDYFEAEAYHLSQWCKDMGFALESGYAHIDLPCKIRGKV